MVQLQKLTSDEDAQVLVKVEALNIGGSIKTRTALAMIEAAEKEGTLHPDSIIVEHTSGNQGIGLALIGAVKGYKVKIIMPDSVSIERRKLVEAYGGEVILVQDNGDIGKAIEDCLCKADEMAKENPKVFIPQQFENPNNPEVHKLYTAKEILKQVDGQIDGFCSGIGTGGTLSGGFIGTHFQMGIGDGLIPKNLNMTIFDDIYIVSDEEAIETAKKLAALEGLMVGISSGSNVCAALKLAKKLGKGKTVVTILPDTAERYFSTVLFE